MAIGKQADVLKPQGRIFRGKLFAGINADIVTGNVIVRRLRDGMRRRNEAVLYIADVVIHFGIGPANIRHGTDKAFDIIHTHAAGLTVIGNIFPRQGIGLVYIDDGTCRMIDTGIGIAFDVVGMDFFHPLLNIDVPPALHIPIGVADQEVIGRHMDRLLGQDHILRRRGLIQINGNNRLFRYRNGHGIIGIKLIRTGCPD